MNVRMPARASTENSKPLNFFAIICPPLVRTSERTGALSSSDSRIFHLDNEDGIQNYGYKFTVKLSTSVIKSCSYISQRNYK